MVYTKSHINRLTTSIIFIATLIIASVLLTLQSTAAGSSFFSFESAGGNIQQGNFTVSVFVNSGSTGVTSAFAEINYDTSRFEFTGFNASGSAFSSEVYQTGGGGSISSARFVSPAGNTISGKNLLVRLNFKTIGVGAGQLQIQSSSSISGLEDNGASVWNGALTTASYSVVAPPSPPPTPTPTPNPNPAPAPSDGNGSNNDSDIPDPGDDNSGQNNGTRPQPTTGQQQANPNSPAPDNTNTAKESKKYLVAIILKDKNGAVLADTNVRLGEGENSQRATTDSTGVAGFVGVVPGTYDLFIETADGEIRRSISIAEDAEDGGIQQEFTIDLSESDSDEDLPWLYIIGGIVAAVVIVSVASYFLSARGRKPKPPFGNLKKTTTTASTQTSQPNNQPVANNETAEALNKVHTDIPAPNTVISPTNKDN